MRAIILSFLLVFSTMPQADSLRAQLREDYPRRYVVKHGDTLWSIANKYLNAPWKWKQLWHANPHIRNPNRLYPGAVLVLDFHKKSPYLKVLSNGTVKLSPAQRPVPADEAIPPIHLSKIKPFLDSSMVFDQDYLENTPYIVAYSGERLRGGQGDEVYVKDLHPDRNIPEGTTIFYAIYRSAGTYIEPITERMLGYKAILVGYAELTKPGDPATILLTTINMGVQLADRVVPNVQPAFNLYFEPQEPNRVVNGTIIDLPGDYTQGATGLVAVLDRGKDFGLKPGDVLGIFSKSRRVRDPMKKYETVELPRERIGEVMVFRSFTHTSFALVVRSTRVVHLNDYVGNP